MQTGQEQTLSQKHPQTPPQQGTPTQESDRRFLSADDCRALQHRIYGMQSREGSTTVRIQSAWAGNLRWARNKVISGGDTQSSRVEVGRQLYGIDALAATNQLDDTVLRETVRRAEGNTFFQPRDPEDYPDPLPAIYPHTEPKIWFDDTYNLGAEQRGRVAAQLIQSARDTQFLSAAYLEAGALARAVSNTGDLSRYYPYTVAQFSVTFRDPKSRGSGWAGVDYNEWRRIDPARLSAIALDKCMRSLDPVAIEPGRYTTILEPQAVCDLWSPVMDDVYFQRPHNEGGAGPFHLRSGQSKIGLRVVDPRITVTADPMDPDCGFPPFDWNGDPYENTTWIENGVLKTLPYPRLYAVTQLGHDKTLANSSAFRMSGGTTSIDEMIETTKRGILVTRFNNIRVLYPPSMLLSANTRDGLWLIENGKIAKAIKNFRVVDSPMFAFNNLVEIGVPQRTFRPAAPAICPPIKCTDFSFTALMDAV